MKYWRKAFLPEWVERIGYSSKTKWVKLIGKLGGIPMSHMGKSRLKFFQARNSAFKIATNGSTSGTWADLQQAPPYAFFNKQIVKKRDRYGYERTSQC